MRYKTIITKENILKIKKHRYVDDNAQLNNEIYIKSKKLLGTSHISANDSEVIALMRLSDFKVSISTDYNDTHVKLSSAMINEMYGNGDKNGYIAMHNHPFNGGFSVGDVHQLLIHDKIIAIIALENSCKHSYFLIKTQRFSRS